MSDGYSALMKEVKSAKPRAPRLLSFDEPAGMDLTGAAFGMSYRDSAGRYSRRWVTVRSIDVYDGTLIAYCWKRRALRTFRLDRVKDVVDGAGEILSADTFFEGLGIHLPSHFDAADKWSDAEDSKGRDASYKPAASGGIGAWLAAQNAAEVNRTGKEMARDGDTPKATDTMLGCLLVLIIVAALVWLIF